MLKVIHTDDDPLCLDSFRTIVQNLDLEYCGGFYNIDDTYVYLKKHHVDILFLDIDMPENGFLLAKKLEVFPVEIIFLTAYTGYEIKAFEACAIDYIIKPASEESIRNGVERYMARIKKRDSQLRSEQIHELYNSYFGKDCLRKIFVTNVGETHVLNLNEILYMGSLRTCTEIYTTDGRKILSSKHLKVYEDVLKQNKDFLRIHRSYLINKTFVTSILKDSKNSRASVILQGKVELEISFLKRESIINNLLREN